MGKSELISRLNSMADRLCPVAGELMSRACRDEEEHKKGCECNTCAALRATHSCMNEMEEMVRLLKEGN